MTTMIRLTSLAMLGLITQAQVKDRAPAFEDYNVDAVWKGPVSPPIFDDHPDVWPDSNPKFREKVIWEVQDGLNFAGEYRLARISCGTACTYFVVVSGRSGLIYRRVPVESVIVGRHRNKQGKEVELKGYEFRLDSRLLVIEGCVNCSDGKAHGEIVRLRLVWESDHFRELSREVIE